MHGHKLYLYIHDKKFYIINSKNSNANGKGRIVTEFEKQFDQSKTKSLDLEMRESLISKLKPILNNNISSTPLNLF